MKNVKIIFFSIRSGLKISYRWSGNQSQWWTVDSGKVENPTFFGPGYGICPLDPISGLWTWYMPLGHGTSGWDMVHAPGTGPHVQHGLHGLHGMDCMAWTAWHGLHGLPCMVCRGKTDLFHFWLVSGHAQGGLHVQCHGLPGLHGLHGLDGISIFFFLVSRGKTDLFHFWSVSDQAQGGLHVRSW